MNYQEICDRFANVLCESDEANTVTGGLKNDCFKYTEDDQTVFVKKYNHDTKYAKHLSSTRCESEFAMCSFLKDNDCAVARPLYCDSERQINIFEYIEGVNLFSDPQLGTKYAKRIIEELVKIHSIPVLYDIGGVTFYPSKKEDIINYLNEAVGFLGEIYAKKLVLIDFCELFERIASAIMVQPQVFGNTQMHNGNIMITRNDSIIFVDFEKAPPHFPQLDLLTFLNARNWSVDEDIEIINYYLEKRGCSNSKQFYEILDLLFVIDNIRAIKKIKKNEKQVKVLWTESGGERTKVYVPSDSTKGLEWNRTRNESVEKRLNNTFEKVYSENLLASELRKIIKDIVF